MPYIKAENKNQWTHKTMSINESSVELQVEDLNSAFESGAASGHVIVLAYSDGGAEKFFYKADYERMRPPEDGEECLKVLADGTDYTYAIIDPEPASEINRRLSHYPRNVVATGYGDSFSYLQVDVNDFKQLIGPERRKRFKLLDHELTDPQDYNPADDEWLTDSMDDEAGPSQPRPAIGDLAYLAAQADAMNMLMKRQLLEKKQYQPYIRVKPYKSVPCSAEQVMAELRYRLVNRAQHQCSEMDCTKECLDMLDMALDQLRAQHQQLDELLAEHDGYTEAIQDQKWSPDSLVPGALAEWQSLMARAHPLLESIKKTTKN